MVRRSGPPLKRARVQVTMKVAGRGVRPQHSRCPESRAGLSGAVTLKSVALTCFPSSPLKPGTLPAGARGRDLPLPNVILLGEN
jgi:hypothetical protein